MTGKPTDKPKLYRYEKIRTALLEDMRSFLGRDYGSLEGVSGDRLYDALKQAAMSLSLVSAQEAKSKTSYDGKREVVRLDDPPAWISQDGGRPCRPYPSPMPDWMCWLEALGLVESRPENINYRDNRLTQRCRLLFDDWKPKFAEFTIERKAQPIWAPHHVFLSARTGSRRNNGPGSLELRAAATDGWIKPQLVLPPMTTDGLHGAKAAEAEPGRVATLWVSGAMEPQIEFEAGEKERWVFSIQGPVVSLPIHLEILQDDGTKQDLNTDQDLPDFMPRWVALTWTTRISEQGTITYRSLFSLRSLLAGSGVEAGRTAWQDRAPIAGRVTLDVGASATALAWAKYPGGALPEPLFEADSADDEGGAGHQERIPSGWIRLLGPEHLAGHWGCGPWLEARDGCIPSRVVFPTEGKAAAFVRAFMRNPGSDATAALLQEAWLPQRVASDSDEERELLEGYRPAVFERFKSPELVMWSRDSIRTNSKSPLKKLRRVDVAHAMLAAFCHRLVGAMCAWHARPYPRTTVSPRLERLDFVCLYPELEWKTDEESVSYASRLRPLFEEGGVVRRLLERHWGTVRAYFRQELAAASKVARGRVDAAPGAPRFLLFVDMGGLTYEIQVMKLWARPGGSDLIQPLTRMTYRLGGEILIRAAAFALASLHGTTRGGSIYDRVQELERELRAQIVERDRFDIGIVSREDVSSVFRDIISDWHLGLAAYQMASSMSLTSPATPMEYGDCEYGAFLSGNAWKLGRLEIPVKDRHEATERFVRERPRGVLAPRPDRRFRSPDMLSKVYLCKESGAESIGPIVQDISEILGFDSQLMYTGSRNQWRAGWDTVEEEPYAVSMTPQSLGPFKGRPWRDLTPGDVLEKDFPSPRSWGLPGAWIHSTNRTATIAFSLGRSPLLDWVNESAPFLIARDMYFKFEALRTLP